MLDPFDAKSAILANTDGAMLRVWTVLPPTTNQPLSKNGGTLTVVETTDGLFLGYLIGGL